MQIPENHREPFAKEQRIGADTSRVVKIAHTVPFNRNMCPPAGTPDYMAPAAKRPRTKATDGMELRYSRGDRFNLQVPGSTEFTGDYVINTDGRVVLPFTGAIQAAGLTNTELSRRVEQTLIRAKLFNPEDFRVAVRPVLYAPINVTVAGAVFLPGRYTINNVTPADKNERALLKSGDSPLDRFVAPALRAAGGVRPDANLAKVVVQRRGQRYDLDWQGALTGAHVDDMALEDGDHVQVTESGCFQSALVRPSQITVPGVRIFLSNMTSPLPNNPNVSPHATGMPYGTRFLTALVSGNCVGGSRASNARRYGVLISRNPKTLETQVIQRSIEELVLSADRDSLNPYLMPDDAIACYDSAVTDIREIATTLQMLVLPANTGALGLAATRGLR